MTNNEFKELLEKVHNDLIFLTDTKGADYTVGDSDQLANFKNISFDTGIHVEQALMVFLNKHLSAIKMWVKRNRNMDYKPSEPIDGRIDDAILYLILLKAIIVDKGKEPKVRNQSDKADLSSS
jgi:hypothetical protein